jgi:hypothetical protein
LGVDDAEDPIDVGEAEDILHRGTQPEENKLLLESLRVLEYLDQRGDAGAIDIAKRLQINRKPLCLP